MVHNNELSDNQAEWILVTPQVASELLATQVKNRPISHQTVKRYADDMKNGNWKQCGDTICVDKDGHLTDGQHRLSAVIESGITIRVLLVRGVEHSIYKDTGSKRTMVGNIKIASDDICEKAKNVSCIAIAKFLSALTNDRRKTDISSTENFLKQYEKDFSAYVDDLGFSGKSKGNIYMRITTLSAFFMAYVSGADIEILNACKEILTKGYSDAEISDPMRFRPIRQYQNVYATSGRLKNFELDMIRKCCVAIRRVETNESVNGKNLSGKSEYDLEFNNKNIKDIINGKETKH